MTSESNFKRKVILYIAMSLDGYIAGPGDDLEFLSGVQSEGEDYGYAKFMDSIDTIITGRKTYEWVVKEIGHYPHQDKEVFVMNTRKHQKIGNVEFYNGDLHTLIRQLKDRSSDKHIFCEGGAKLAAALFKEGLIDEIILSVVPVMIGAGVRLFERGLGKTEMKLLKTESFESGLVQLHYEKL